MSGRPRVKIDVEAMVSLRDKWGFSWRDIAFRLGIGATTLRKAYQGCAKTPPKLTKEGARTKILGRLRERGADGCMNFELAMITLRYGARIFELRKRGFEIETRRESEGGFRFVLLGRTTEFSTVSTNFPKDIGTQ